MKVHSAWFYVPALSMGIAATTIGNTQQSMMLSVACLLFAMFGILAQKTQNGGGVNLNVKNKLKYAAVPLLIFLFVFGVAGPLIETYVIPTIGKVGTVETNKTWLNGTVVTLLDWGLVENGTETMLPELINITNVGNKPATLYLGYSNLVNVTALILTWNYTGSPLNPNISVLVQLNQTLTASYETYSYDTWINATAT